MSGDHLTMTGSLLGTPVLHEPRAGPGGRHRRAQRPLLGGLRALRDAGGPEGLPGRGDHRASSSRSSPRSRRPSASSTPTCPTRWSGSSRRRWRRTPDAALPERARAGRRPPRPHPGGFGAHPSPGGDGHRTRGALSAREPDRPIRPHDAGRPPHPPRAAGSRADARRFRHRPQGRRASAASQACPSACGPQTTHVRRSPAAGLDTRGGPKVGQRRGPSHRPGTGGAAHGRCRRGRRLVLLPPQADHAHRRRGTDAAHVGPGVRPPRIRRLRSPFPRP